MLKSAPLSNSLMPGLLVFADQRSVDSPAVRASNKVLLSQISVQTFIIIAGGGCRLRQKVIFIDPKMGDRILAFECMYSVLA